MTSLPPQEQRENLLGEMLLLGLLGRLLYQYPEDEQRAWFQELIDSETFSEVPFAADQEDMGKGLELLGQWSEAGLDGDSYKAIQSDYLRLFIGPDKVIAPPWESVFFDEDRQTFKEQTLQVRNWYRRHGLEPEKLYHEPDDHIGLEMSFLSHLAGQALQALDEGDTQKFEELQKARAQFLSDHPLKWVFQWCDLVTQNARTNLYQGAAYLVRGALLSMAQQYELQGANEAAR